MTGESLSLSSQHRILNAPQLVSGRELLELLDEVIANGEGWANRSENECVRVYVCEVSC